MDAAIAYEMRVRFRQDMAAAFGDEWKPERLPKIEPVGRPRTGDDLVARVLDLRRQGRSYNEIGVALKLANERVWAILCRWAPELLDKGAA